jgi:hypothetical protein
MSHLLRTDHYQSPLEIHSRIDNTSSVKDEKQWDLSNAVLLVAVRTRFNDNLTIPSNPVRGCVRFRSRFLLSSVGHRTQWGRSKPVRLFIVGPPGV